MKKILLIITFILLSTLLQANEFPTKLLLNTPETGNKIYIAKESIVMSPGFSYKSTDNNTFQAYIDPLSATPEGIEFTPGKIIINNPVFEGEDDFYETYPHVKINKDTQTTTYEFLIESGKVYLEFYFEGHNNWQSINLNRFLDFDQFRIISLDRKTIVLPYINQDYSDAISRYYLLNPGRYAIEVFYSSSTELESCLQVYNYPDQLKDEKELQNATITEISYTEKPKPEPESEPQPTPINPKDTTVHIITGAMGALTHLGYYEEFNKFNKDCLAVYKFKVRDKKVKCEIRLEAFSDHRRSDYVHLSKRMNSFKIKNIDNKTIVEPHETYDEYEDRLYFYVLNKGEYQIEVDYSTANDMYVWFYIEISEPDSEYENYVPIEILDPNAPEIKIPEIKIPEVKVSEIKIPEVNDPSLGNIGINNLGINYSYDENGNRTNRKLISLLKTRSINDESEEKIVHVDYEIKAKIYPNPTQGQMFIEILDSENIDICTLSIYNINGSRILTKEIKESSTILDISSQPRGIYILQINKGNVVSKWKIIKD